jgi:hypothetical protein
MHIRISIPIFTLDLSDGYVTVVCLFIIRYQVPSSSPALSVLEVSSALLPDNHH